VEFYGFIVRGLVVFSEVRVGSVLVLWLMCVISGIVFG